jgi:hypothetical protein
VIGLSEVLSNFSKSEAFGQEHCEDVSQIVSQALVLIITLLSCAVISNLTGGLFQI